MTRAAGPLAQGIQKEVSALGEPSLKYYTASPPVYRYLSISRYNHYVEMIEPSTPRACIRCCDDPDDCPTTDGVFCSNNIFTFVLKSKYPDTAGCPAIIPGNYFDCE